MVSKPMCRGAQVAQSKGDPQNEGEEARLSSSFFVPLCQVRSELVANAVPSVRYL